MKQGTHQEEAASKYLWMDAQTRGNWEGTKQAQAATSRLEGVGNTTGSVQTLPSARSRATAYGGEVEGREVDTKSECGAEWRVSAVTAEGAEQGGSDAGGELTAIQRRATGRRQAVALCGWIVQGRGVWGGEGEITTVPFHTSN